MFLPDAPSPTDQQLVAASQQGSQEAWALLVERYYPRLRRYLNGHTGDSDLAADLTHDVFLAAGDLLDRLPAERPFVPWLYRIAQNHLKRAKRRRGRFERRVVSLEWLVEQPGPLYASLRQSDDLEASVAEAQAVQNALALMRPALRYALLLNILMDLPASAVADVLGLSLAAAERRISRAKADFRSRYNALGRGTAGE